MGLLRLPEQPQTLISRGSGGPKPESKDLVGFVSPEASLLGLYRWPPAPWVLTWTFLRAHILGVFLTFKFPLLLRTRDGFELRPPTPMVSFQLSSLFQGLVSKYSRSLRDGALGLYWR